VLAAEKDLFTQSYRRVVFGDNTRINYESIKFYYDELTAYDDTELARQAINDQMDIQDLITHMQNTSDKLAKLAAGIKKVSDVVGALAEITTKAMSAGLLGGA